ncbi:hypothetical protein LX32DRAFT_13869 [Colletotrichum zoysiae]|uniref:Uncharacterized protein n=1 Tax=Colletotrichum zoysiae TaxID=1216348 RepID=A0AAD9HDC9_9PEZI|nr:hypothetical protein LX32DRAFT_13869 [Colletotrichum zoysiae]
MKLVRDRMRLQVRWKRGSLSACLSVWFAVPLGGRRKGRKEGVRLQAMVGSKRPHTDFPLLERTKEGSGSRKAQTLGGAPSRPERKVRGMMKEERSGRSSNSNSNAGRSKRLAERAGAVACILVAGIS